MKNAENTILLNSDPFDPKVVADTKTKTEKYLVLTHSSLIIHEQWQNLKHAR